MTSPPPLVNFSKPPPNLKINSPSVSTMATPVVPQPFHPLNNNNQQQSHPVYPLNQHYQQQQIFLPPQSNDHLLATAVNQSQTQQYYIVSSPTQPQGGYQDNPQMIVPSIQQDPSAYHNVANGQVMFASEINQQNYVVQPTNNVQPHWNGHISYESINQAFQNSKNNQNSNSPQIYTPPANLISMPRSDNHQTFAQPQYQILQVVTAPPVAVQQHQQQPLQSQHLIQTDATTSSSQSSLIQNAKQPTISSSECEQLGLPTVAPSSGPDGTTIPVHMKVQNPDGTFQFVPCLLYYPMTGS